LLAAIPRLDGPAGHRLVPISGQPPDLARLPPGCAFAPRCTKADARCATERPVLREVMPLHFNACHHDVD
jgi:oligopeptide transport system ATP-binding protein